MAQELLNSKDSMVSDHTLLAAVLRHTSLLNQGEVRNFCDRSGLDL